MMRPHFDALYNAGRRIAASASDAEDLVQDVCMKAYLKMDELERLEYQRAWLLRVLYNLFIDGKRQNQRCPVSHASSSTESLSEDELVGSAHLQPEEQADRMMRVEIVLRAMELLNKEQCSLLALHDIDGFSLAELHTLTGLPIGTLKSQLHRTRVKLGRLLRRDAVKRPTLRIVGE